MNILIVDDDEGIRKTVSNFLTRAGHKVFECESGKETLKILKNENVHIVLSDILMPGMDGNELLKRIKKSPDFKETIVILITGYGNVKGAVEAMRNGAYDYLLKPINIRELITIIERISEYLTLKKEHKELSVNFDKRLKSATKEIKKELEDIKKAYAQEVGTAEIGLYSENIRRVFRIAKRLHNNPDIPVLIEGETGTGKEIVARYIHYAKGDVTTAFIGINCPAITPNLFESELFGYEAGAFTGGNPKGQKGKIELAGNGTIFLDEIGELPPEYQAKLLRVIQEREYYKVGGLRKLKTNARFIFATNQDIKKKLSEGAFRKDLYYRLKVGHIIIPPLKERTEEIIPLAKMFLLQLKEQKKTNIGSITSSAIEILKKHNWPGNVRELKSTIERIALLWDDVELKPEHLEVLFQDTKQIANIPQKNTISGLLSENENFELNKWILTTVKEALIKHNWNKTATAQYLGISRGSLYTYIKLLKKEE